MTDETREFHGAGVDDEPDEAVPAGELFKASMFAELATEIEKDDLILEVRTRPGWAVRYSTFIDAGLLDKWVKKSTVKGEGLDQFGLSLRTLAGQCKGILRGGQDIVLDGEPVTFGHPEIRKLYGAVDVIGTVRAFFGDDALVGAHYVDVLDAAGSGERPVRLDPTNGSSG